ncbi:MAG: hypothetical protein RLZZ249_68 [Actinomycetota bacterium]
MCTVVCIYGSRGGSLDQNSYFYLLGLMCGKGYLYPDTKQVAIEFAHSNEFIDGIANCPDCGFLATKAPSSDSLKCKNTKCGRLVSKDVKKRYEQSQSTKDSAKNVIVPFLTAGTEIQAAISGNKSMTMLILGFSSCPELFDRLATDLKSGSDFSNLRIPEAAWLASPETALEFLNGLLDATGYANAGSWIPRDGRNGSGRMRLYLQIVRNWHLTAEIDAFIRDVLGRPVQTVDWGHPNIRDSKLQDFRESRETAWAREHQIKFFPEYFQDIHFRLKHKDLMFRELLDHNLKCDFAEDRGWFPPAPIRDSTRKAQHPGEQDPRLPREVRRHFDAFWQVNLALGSKSFGPLLEEAENPATYALTGDLSSRVDPEALTRVLEGKWLELASGLAPAREKPTARTKPRKSESAELEKATYGPLTEILKQELENEFGPDVFAYDTSSGNLSSFLARLDFAKVQTLEEWDFFNIRPDVVGFATTESRPFFIESKIELLNLKHLGQLLGYAAAANPKRAILVSTLPLSEGFTRAILRTPDILNYGEDGQIEIAQLENGALKYWGQDE